MTISANYPNLKPSLLLDFANTKTLDPRITFSRPTTATYYDGKTVAKAEENTHIHSEAINSWSNNTNATISTNVSVAPDGNTTADKVIPNNGATLCSAQQAQSARAGTNRIASIYAKADGFNFINIGINSTFITTQANLSTGVISFGSGTITNVGNGWYRISTPAINWGNNSVFFQVGETSGTATLSTADGVKGVLMWGAQVEARDTVTAYTATTTAPITNYVPVLLSAPANVARFEHNPVTGESLGLEIEEQRTNLLLQSEDLDTTWSETRATLNLNSVIAPNGTLTADKLIASTDNDTHFTTQTFTGTAVAHTFSAYAKAGGLNFVALRLFNGATQVGLAYYNLSTGATGTVTAGTASIQNAGNGWYRCVLTATLAASASCTADIFLANADNTNSFAGNAFSGVTIWGTQVEVGAFSTSYIPTVASQVTRSADSASMTGTNFSSWYRADSSTFYYDFANGNVSRHFGEGPYDTFMGAVTNGVRGGAQNSLAFNNGWFVNTRTASPEYSSVIVAGSGSATTISSPFKIATFLDQTAMGGSGNGGSVTTTAFTRPLTESPNMLYFGSQLNGCIKKLAYYPKRLTNAELQGVTTV